MHRPMWAGAIVALLLMQATAAHGFERTVTESEAIRLFLRESPWARLTALRAREREAELKIESALPNPSVAYQVEDAAGTRDEFLTFQQELPISGRRSALRDSAGAAAASSRLLGRRELQNALHSMRTAFYEVVYHDAVIEILEDGERELREAVEVLRVREREGEGSGYDLLRAGQELSELQVRLGKARAARLAARARFGSFFGESLEMESVEVRGDLSVEGLPPSADDAVETAMAERPDLSALQDEIRRRDLELRAARRMRWPEPTVSLGWKRVEADQSSDTGFVASVLVPVPIFGRGVYESIRAGAGSDGAQARKEILRREIRAEVKSALARTVAAAEAAERFGDEASRRGEDLWRIARIAYEEGEMGILDLMDAHRTWLGMKLKAFAVRHEAKQERIALDRALGREVSP